jgi:NAD(P)H-dependent FMN reductase
MISGSLRKASTNTAVLRTAITRPPNGVRTVPYEGMAGLPHFNPDNDCDPLDESVEASRASIRAADALLFSVPEYAGALPGSFKNLLDWLIGDDHPRSIYEKPVAWINTSPRGAVHAHESLRTVLTYAHAVIVEEACVHVPVTAAAIDSMGVISDVSTVARISNCLSQLARYVNADALESGR